MSKFLRISSLIFFVALATVCAMTILALISSVDSLPVGYLYMLALLAWALFGVAVYLEERKRRIQRRKEIEAMFLASMADIRTEPPVYDQDEDTDYLQREKKED